MGRKAKSKAKKRASSSASAASESSSLANSMVSSVAGDDERASLVEPLTEPEEEAGKADDVAVVAQEEAATEKVAVKTAVEEAAAAVEEAAAAVEEAAVEVIEVAREETTVLLETETVTATSSVEEVAVAQQETAVEEIAVVADEETVEAATLITETVATTATSIEEHAIAVQETAVEEVVEVAHEETVKTTTLTTETVTTTEASVEEVAVVQLETAVEDFAVDAHEEAAFATDTVATFVVEEVGNGQEETAVEEVADEETTTSTVTSSHVEAHVEESVSTDIKAVSYAETVETATSKTEPLTSSVGSAVALEESVTELATVIAPQEATSFMTETVTTNNEAVASMEETTSEDVAFDAREETVETTTIKTETVVTTSSNLIHTAREEVPALNSETSTVTTTEGVEEHSTLEAESVVSTTVETVELVETSRVEVEVASLVETEDVQEPSEVEVVVAAGVEACQAVVHEDTAFSDDIQAKTEPLYIDESSKTKFLTTAASEEGTSASFAVEAVEDAAGVVEEHTDAAKLEVEDVVDVTKANAHTDASDTEIEDASVPVEFLSNGVTKEVLSSNTETSESVTDEVPEAGDAATFTREFVVEDKYQEEIITKSERFDEEEVADSTSANAFVEETEVTIESQSDVETIVQQERADFQVAPTSLDVAAFYYRDSATNEPVTEIEAGTTVDAPEEPKSSGHRTEVTHVMTIDELEIGSAEDSTSIQYSDAVLNGASSNTEPAPLSQDKKTRSRPMLTTERSFVMEDDDTVKADDTVVVGERVSTDGEDDYEDLASHVTENLQSVAMSPVVEKRNLEEMHPTPTRKSSVTAPTASSLARRSSEDGSFSVTPTRSRSRSSSGSKYASPPSSTGFVKPPPAPPTVPVPPKRASIMAPTASSSAKQFGDDAVPSKAPSRARASSSEAKPSVSDTGFIKPPPPPPTVPVPPKRASIMAPTASYAAKLQTEEVKKPLTRPRPAPNAKPEISETGFVKPPPAAPTVPVPPKRASIMAPTASYTAKHQAEAPKKPAVRARASPNAKPEVSETGFVKPPPPPPTVPVAPKRASIMAPTASSAAKRGGSESRSDDSWARDAPPKPVSKPKGEFVPTVPVAPKRASIMAPTASFRAKSSPEVAVEDLSPPPEEPKQPLYRNKRYANVQSKVRGIINAPAKAHPEVKKPAPPPQETPAPVQKPTMFKSKRYANVQSKIKDIIHSGPAETNGEASVVNRRRSLGSVKRDSLADAVSRRSSLAGTSARHPGVARAEPNDAFARVLAERSHKKKLDNVVPRYLSYQNSGVYAQRAQVQHDRRRRLQEENSSKSQTRQQQLRVMFAERMHANFNPMDAAHTQAALGNVGAKARRVKTRGSRSSSQSGSASDEFSLSATSDSKAGPVAVAGGVIVIPSRDEETVVEEDVVVETTTATVEVATALSEVDDDGITKKINFDDTSDDEEEELESTTPVPVADVA